MSCATTLQWNITSVQEGSTVQRSVFKNEPDGQQLRGIAAPAIPH